MVPPNNVWENVIKNQCKVTKVWTTLQLQLERTRSRSPMFQHQPWRNGPSSSISLKTRCITADSSSMSSCLASFPNLESCFATWTPSSPIQNVAGIQLQCDLHMELQWVFSGWSSDYWFVMSVRSEFSLQARHLTLRIRLGKRQWRLWTMQAVLCKRVLQGWEHDRERRIREKLIFLLWCKHSNKENLEPLPNSRSWKASWMLPNFSEMLRASPCQAQAKCSQPRRNLVHLFIHFLHNFMQIFGNRGHQFISSFLPWKLQFISFVHGILVGCPTHLWCKYPTHC